MVLRYLEKFESTDASISYTFPTNAYEWESMQPYRMAFEAVSGADGAWDHHGFGEAPMDIASESIRAMVVGTDASNANSIIAEARAECFRIGQGKLFTTDGTTRRWAYARATAAPQLRVAVGQKLHAPLILNFSRVSPWFGTSATTGTQAVDETPEDFTINNPGDMPVHWMTFRFRANAADGFTTPVLTNSTNGYSFTHSRTAADGNSEVRINTETHEAEWSTNDGGSYADDISNFSLGATQVGWMRLEPGNNSMSYTDSGTPNLSLEWSFDAAYAH